MIKQVEEDDLLLGPFGNYAWLIVSCRKSSDFWIEGEMSVLSSTGQTNTWRLTVQPVEVVHRPGDEEI